MIETIEDSITAVIDRWQELTPRTRLIVSGVLIFGFMVGIVVATTRTSYLTLEAAGDAQTYELSQRRNQALIVDLAERRSIDHLRAYARANGYVAIGPVTYAP